MPELPCQQAQLATMVGLVSHEVADKVHGICGKVLPRGRWDGPTSNHREPDERNDAFAAAAERTHELRWLNNATINRLRD